MRRVFVDTSAFLALLVSTDDSHAAARRAWASLHEEEASLVTTSYVLVETYALLGRRLGLGAVRAFRSEMAPLLEVVWIDEEVHEAGLELLLERSRKRLSLVDATSFFAARRAGVDAAFAFDAHFAEEGFASVA